MWNQVRGPGLAYGYNIYPSVTEGLLHLELTEAAHPIKAFKATKALLVGEPILCLWYLN
jgi:Zn-dependent M16 (insulinase) family peptidase